ncbi:rhomboid-domain-containing protein [Pseudovirgaria hyperparasitica]|uniref:Rhomboid-domain-containing protein n=1 Tax=Pseudovirgaria hyperparasitica TaxID=470096 RepID=A0A6A6WD01_9PEZI|nr:rhomboid-domain-containing protein [Pseudovirgaria hyperparasitica]KAF2760712.1 rhomboid-domain-containing protein [Pseudovirgaria hyperparasitica]
MASIRLSALLRIERQCSRVSTTLCSCPFRTAKFTPSPPSRTYTQRSQRRPTMPVLRYDTQAALTHQRRTKARKAARARLGLPKTNWEAIEAEVKYAMNRGARSLPKADYKRIRNLTYGLIGLNVAVYMLEPPLSIAIDNYRRGSADVGGDTENAKRTAARVWSAKVKHLYLSVKNWQEGRWWTLLTSAFVHGDTFHILSNMMGMYAFGTILARAPGLKVWNVATIAFGSALSSSVGALIGASVKESRNEGLEIITCGASGLVMGLGGAAAVLAPYEKLIIWAVPIPIQVAAVGFATWDLFFINDESSRTAHAGHLGGLFFGVGWTLWRLRHLRGL